MTKKTQKTEIWKAVKGYAGHYQVSNTGKVKCVKKLSDGTRVDRILVPRINSSGYEYIAVSKPGEKKVIKAVHGVVAEAFIRNRSKKIKEVDHKDGNRRNNNVENLRWVTHTDNCRFGKNAKSITVKGKTYKSISDACDHFKINSSVYNTRVNKLGWTPEKALTTPVRKRG